MTYFGDEASEFSLQEGFVASICEAVYSHLRMLTFRMKKAMRLTIGARFNTIDRVRLPASRRDQDDRNFRIREGQPASRMLLEASAKKDKGYAAGIPASTPQDRPPRERMPATGSRMMTMGLLLKGLSTVCKREQ